jgi:hypothetical protein
MVFEQQPQIMTEAGLFIHPITYDDFGIPHDDEDEAPAVVQPIQPEENLDVNNNLNAQEEEQIATTEQEAQTASPEPDINEILKRAHEFVGSVDDDEELDAEMQRKIEEMIESVMSSAKEEAEWIRKSNENVFVENEEKIEEIPIDEPEIAREEVIESQSQISQEAPLPPPRRKAVTEEVEEVTAVEDEEPSIRIDNLQLEESHGMSEERPSSPFPSRLHLTSLEIDNLSVTQLQAGRILASEIDSHSIVTNELECKLSSSLPNSGATIEIPPGLIEEIVERVRCAERAEQQQHQQEQKVVEEPPIRPPLPSQYQPQTTQIPASFYQLRDYSEDEQPHLPAPHRRRKHHPKQRKESTSEEDAQKDQRPRSRAGTSAASDQSVLGLGGQFLRACGNSLFDSGNHLMEVLRAASKDEQSRDLHIALVILIIIVAGLFLMGMGEKSVHHHHWDFFNPGENR